MNAALARQVRARLPVVLPLLALILAGSCSPTQPKIGFQPHVGTIDSYPASGQVTLDWAMSTNPPCIDLVPCPPPGPPIDHIVILQSQIGPNTGYEPVYSSNTAGSGSTTVTGLVDGRTYWFKAVAVGAFGERRIEAGPVMTMPGPLTTATVSTPIATRGGFAWAPDAREIAYIDESAFDRSNVNVLDVATLASRAVTFYPPGDSRLLGVSWSPDGGSILYTHTPTSTAGGIDYRVWSVGLDEYAPQPITPGRVDFDGSWGGDGWVYFCRGTYEPPNVPEIWRTKPALEGPEPLTGDRRVRKYHPEARAQDDLIVYTGEPVNNSTRRKLYLMSPDSKVPILLTSERDYADTAPSWAPDGRSVVFISDRSGHPEAWSIDVGSRKLTQLTRGLRGTAKVEARWSPVGQRLAVLDRESFHGSMGRLDIIDMSGPLP